MPIRRLFGAIVITACAAYVGAFLSPIDENWSLSMNAIAIFTIVAAIFLPPWIAVLIPRRTSVLRLPNDVLNPRK